LNKTTTAPGRRGLLVDGIISLSGPTGGRITIRGLGERIAIDIERPLLTLALVSRRPSRAARRRWLLAGQSALDLAKVSVDLCVDGHPVGRFDWKTRGTAFTRLLGLGPIDLSLRRLILALVRGRSSSVGA
jgi:hypothetical protein